MRNLYVHYERSVAAREDGGLGVQAGHVTPQGHRMACDGTKVWMTMDMGEGEEEEVSTLDCPASPESLGRCHSILDLDDELTFLLAFEAGSLFRLDWPAQKWEEVGCLDAGTGLVDVTRSPDQDFFLLVTRQLTVILMSREFDPLKEMSVHNVQETGFVNVGWGKKETQFHGSLGKGAAAQAAEAAGRPPQPVFPWDDGLPRVVWHEDGQRFAVSYVTPEEDGPDSVPVRRLRVFDRQGDLLSTSERVDGLESSLAWRPSAGAAPLASTERRVAQNRHLVAFFEPNGLRHGDLLLPFPADAQDEKAVVVEHLEWNRDADALMVVSRRLKESEDDAPWYYVHVYTASNYHWSLKQSWTYRERLVHVQWDTTHSLKFHLISSSGTYTIIQLGCRVDHSFGTDADDLSYAAVIDGRTLRVSPLRQTLVPPPMSAFELHLPDNIRQVCFSPMTTEALIPGSNSLCVMTESSQLFFFIPSDAAKAAADPDLKLVKVTGAGGAGFAVKSSLLHEFGSCQLDKESSLSNLCWLAEDRLLASVSTPLPGLVELKLTRTSGDGRLVCYLKEVHPCDDVVYSIVCDVDGETAAVQLRNGDVLRYQLSGLAPWELLNGDPLHLPSACPASALAYAVGGTGQLHFIGLTTRHRLYRDNTEIAANITSFSVHSDFLLATTMKHTLRCLPLANLSMASANADAPWFSESVRSLERGSRLILAVPSDSKTILQMPRGNLEAIHPRALTLKRVKNSLGRLQYGEALEILRRQRINQNLIVDHDPGVFLQNVAKFVAEVGKDAQRMCQFVADLQNEDCTLTMYRSIYPDRQPYSDWPDKSNKVDTVCEQLMLELEKDEQKLLLPILSCLIKSSRSDVDSALQRIEKVRDANPSLADSALQFLLLLVDVNALFDVALGLYDFDLVLFVAEKSQKDPKEYLPFLNDLKKLPLTLRKYRIDLHLKRYGRALEHLSQVTDEHNHAGECIELVKAQRLYLDALKLFPKDSFMMREVCRAYGDYLSSKRYFEDSALIFVRGRLHTEALDAWERSLNWRHCLGLATSSDLDLSQKELRELCGRLCEGLKNDGRFAEAADILREYMDDVEEAVAVLVTGRCWAEAARLIAKAGRADLNETHFLPGLREHADACLSSVRNNRSTFDSDLARLAVVLETKQKLKDGLYDEVNINVEDADLYSDITSVTGAMSALSVQKSNPASLKTRDTQRSKSSKNRRKHEKKKYSTKEGSAYEDLGLIASLHHVIQAAYKATAEVGELTRALLLTTSATDRDQARTLQSELSSFLDVVERSVGKIWKDTTGSAGAGGGGDDPANRRFGPEATTADIIEQKTADKGDYVSPYGILEPHLRHPPKANFRSSWKLQILL